MRTEILRMSNVTFRKNGKAYLRNFELSVAAGQIMGLLLVDGYGAKELVDVLLFNEVLYNGCVYYCGERVNSWRQFPRKRNRITWIDERGFLIYEQNTLTNIFVLQAEKHYEILHDHLMEEAFRPYLEEAGLQIDPYQPVGKLSAYEQAAIELLKGISSGSRLVILQNIDNALSDRDLEKFGKLIRHYAEKGTSFLWLSSHLEALQGVCGQIGIMKGGGILSVLDEADALNQVCEVYSAEFSRSVRMYTQNRVLDAHAPEVFRQSGISCRELKKFGFSVRKGECLCLQFLDNHVYETIEKAYLEGVATLSGEIDVEGKHWDRKDVQDVAILSRNPDEKNLFPDLTFFDNVAMTMDYRYPAVWRDGRARRNLREELKRILGHDLWDKSIQSMSKRERYEVLYCRLLLQRPKVIIEFQPFHQADVQERFEIWKINEELLKEGIAVVLFSIGLSDSLAIADRLIRVESSGKWEEYRREDFGRLSRNIPWISMYR